MRRIVIALALLLPLSAAAVIGTVKTAEVTCGTTATPLATSLSVSYLRSLVVTVPSSAAGSVFIGGADVTALTGLEVEPGKTFASGDKIDKADKDGAGGRLYCIVAAGTVKVRVMEAY